MDHCLMGAIPGVSEMNWESIHKLTDMQLAQVTGSLMDPERPHGSTGYSVSLPFEVDIPALRHCIAAFVNANPVLRSRYIPCEVTGYDAFYRAVANVGAIDFEVVDVSGSPPLLERREEYADEFVYQPFDLFDGSLIRFQLLKITDSLFQLTVAAHHSITDGASLHQLCHDVIGRYLDVPYARHSNIAKGDAFKQYADSQQRINECRQQKVFWQKQLRNVRPLSISTPLPDTKRWQHRKLLLSTEHTQWIKAFCRQRAITPSLFFKGLYGLLVHCYCVPTADFVIQDVIRHRPKGHESAQGCYIHQLPFVFPYSLLKGTTSVDGFFRYLRSYQKRVKAYRYFSIQKQKDMLLRGSIEFGFNYYQYPPITGLSDTVFDMRGIPSQIENYLQFIVTQSAAKGLTETEIKQEQFELNIFYFSDCFDDLCFLERVASLAKQIVQPQGRITNVSDLQWVLSGRERRTLEVDWNKTAKKFSDEMLLHRRFEKQAGINPDRMALKSASGEVSYRQLNILANGIAHHLLGVGVKKGDHIGLYMERSIEFVASLLAILKIGAVYLPLDKTYPHNRIRFIIQKAEPTLLLVKEEVKEEFEEGIGGELPVINIEGILENVDETLENPSIEISPESIAYLLFTSGSTGHPKGALIRHNGMQNHVDAEVDALGISPNFTMLQLAPASSDISVWQFLGPISGGGTTVIFDNAADIPEMVDIINRQTIDVVEVVPVVLDALIEYLGRHTYCRFNTLRRIMVTGEAVSVQQINAWLNISPDIPIINAYGPTEASDDVVQQTITTPLTNAIKSVPIGKPIANMQVFILDDKLRLLPAGVDGEICVAGVGVGAGYYKDEAQTQARFVENPFGEGVLYKTGDIGQWLKGGSIVYRYRKDDMVNINGIRVEVAEIEYQLQCIPQIASCLVTIHLVTGLQASTLNKLASSNQLVAYYTLKRKIKPSRIKSMLANHLPVSMLPTYFVELDEFPVGPSGKIDRKRLPKPSRVVSERERILPVNQLQEELLIIWQDLFKSGDISIDDDFVDLGGNSLHASRVAMRLRAHHDLAVKDVLAHPTIERLSLFLQT